MDKTKINLFIDEIVQDRNCTLNIARLSGLIKKEIEESIPMDAEVILQKVGKPDMTTKEKAIDMWDKMENTAHCKGIHYPNNNYCECSVINRYQAGQCAFVAITAIIDECEKAGIDDEYWYDVRYELANLLSK
jgi:hypothetical protein